MAPPSLARRFPARPDQVRLARREVEAYAREHGAVDPDGIALAVSEAVTNAVIHAYVDAPQPGDVEVFAKRHLGDGLEVRVCDDGRGMMPRSDSPGLGVGLPLVAKLAQRFRGWRRARRRDGDQHGLPGPRFRLTAPGLDCSAMSAYAIVHGNEVQRFYEGSDVPGEFRRLTDALDAEQLAVTLIRVPPHSDFEQGTGHSTTRSRSSTSSRAGR